ncbi:MAG: hypothetical protein RMK00_07250 [Bacteroidota bacterium]|nr:hypothetical protein [Bacteroidota bacterium]
MTAVVLFILCYSVAAQSSKLGVRSEFFRNYLQKQPERARFHAMFIVPRPRLFPAGDALIGVLIEQLRQQKFSGSITAIVGIRRYYSEIAYLRSLGWNVPLYIDSTGAVLRAVGLRSSDLPVLTIWDSTGALWWWSHVERVPTGPLLQRFLDSLSASSQPLLPNFESQVYAQSVGIQEGKWPYARISQVVELEDDSTTGVGLLWHPVISPCGKWLALWDGTNLSVCVYEALSGKLICCLRPFKVVSRALSWFLSDSAYKDIEPYLHSALLRPQFDDESVLWTIQVSYYVQSYRRWPSRDSSATGIWKSYHLLGYQLPQCSPISSIEIDNLYIPSYCRECVQDRNAFFSPSEGLVIASKDKFCLPFFRGRIEAGDTIPANPYENPFADEYYTISPLFGVFSFESGGFLGDTYGSLSKLRKKYGIGFSLEHDSNILGCDTERERCAWAQWLGIEIEFSDGDRIPLRHYWNKAMLDTAQREEKQTTPTAEEIEYLLDSAGAEIKRVILTPAHVWVLWKIKQQGHPLRDNDYGFWVVQQYDLQTKTLKGEWQLPREYKKQQLVNIVWDAARKSVAGLYQGPWKTSVVYYALDVPPSRTVKQ